MDSDFWSFPLPSSLLPLRLPLYPTPISLSSVIYIIIYLVYIYLITRTRIYAHARGWSKPKSQKASLSRVAVRDSLIPSGQISAFAMRSLSVRYAFAGNPRPSSDSSKR